MTVLNRIKNNRFLFFSAAVADFLFFFLLAQLHYRIFLMVAQHLKILMEMLTKNISQLSIADMQQPDILNDVQFIFHYKELLKGLFFLLVGFYLIWLVFRGIAWLIAHRMSGTKITLFAYIRRFFTITTLGMILFFCTIILFLSLMNYVAFSLFPIISPVIAQGLTFAVMIVLHYIYSVGIAGIARKQWYKFLTFRLQIIIPYLASILWFIAATGITIVISRANFYAGLAFVAVIIMPSITCFRIFCIRNLV